MASDEPKSEISNIFSIIMPDTFPLENRSRLPGKLRICSPRNAFPEVAVPKRGNREDFGNASVLKWMCRLRVTALLHQCPFCTTPPNTPMFPGNARHAHCLCTNDTLCNIRNLSNTAINATLAKLQLLQGHVPHPTTSIVDAIGDALTAADAPSGGTHVVTSATTLRTEITHGNHPPPSPQHILPTTTTSVSIRPPGTSHS